MSKSTGPHPDPQADEPQIELLKEDDETTARRYAKEAGDAAILLGIALTALDKIASDSSMVTERDCANHAKETLAEIERLKTTGSPNG